MTNDYYINLADYYTNQLVATAPSESITLTEPYTVVRFNIYLLNEASNIGASSYYVQGYLTWNGTKNFIIYGYFLDSSDNYMKSFMLRVPFEGDNYDLTNAEIYTTYVGGTNLPKFVELKADNDGSIYGIVGTPGSFSLIMLGNPFITGGIKFRQSYAIPGTYSSYTNYQKLIKKENTGEYLIILNNGSNTTLILHLTINVGVPSDWVSTTYASSLTVYDYYITWSDTIDLYLLTSSNTDDNFYILYYNGTSITQTQTHPKALTTSMYTNLATASGKFYDSNTFYYITSYVSGTTGYNVLYKGNLTNNTNELISSKTATYNTGTATYVVLTMLRRQQIEVIDGIVYFKYAQMYGDQTVENYGVIINNNVYTIRSTLVGIFFTNFNTFFVQNTFNMYKILNPAYDVLDIVAFQYNANGYNGTPYINTNVLVPNRMQLYDDLLTTLLFDRGLYNLKVYNNVTEATFNVPYTMLNTETIGEAKLYGETGYELVDKYIQINKNIYENLMINFFNSIVVKDYTGRIYNSGGSRVNDSISKTNDMNNASANKIKLFYSDNTTHTYGLPAPTITGVGNPMTITYEIPLVVDSDGYALKYQILSNDENTLYFEYDTSSLNAGTYKITQECKIK